MTYEEFHEALEAVHEGRASDLATCPIDGSLQGVASTWSQPQSFADPSEVVTLRCGHVIL